MNATAQLELMQKSSMIELFGYQFNIYAIIALVLFGIFLWALYRAHKAGNVDWLDMITNVDQQTGDVKVSTTKVLQLVGGLTGTFIVIKLTLQNSINWDIFAIYLSYVASIDGFSKFMLAKYGVAQTPPAAPAPPPPAPVAPPAPVPPAPPAPGPVAPTPPAPPPQQVQVTVDVNQGSAKPPDIDP